MKNRRGKIIERKDRAQPDKKNRAAKKNTVKTSNKRKAGQAKPCVVCGNIALGDENYCPECDAFYCHLHRKSSEWQSVAAGIDYQYRSVECPKGHQIAFEESYA